MIGKPSLAAVRDAADPLLLHVFADEAGRAAGAGESAAGPGRRGDIFPLVDASDTPAGTFPNASDGAGGTGGTSRTVGASGIQAIDGLLRGLAWNSAAITYTDPDDAADYQAGYLFDNNGNSTSAQNEGFGRISAAQLYTMQYALDLAIASQLAGAGGFTVEGFTNLGISYGDPASGAGNIRAANTSDNAFGYAFFPSASIYGGDVWLGTAIRTPNQGNYSWNNTLHELGHALGLKHGQEAGGVANTALPTSLDSVEFTVMTYRSYVGQTTNGYRNEAFGYPQTYMMLDIAALQFMYGADFTSNAGDTVYTWSATTGQSFVNGAQATNPGANRVFMTIWDGGGTDTYDLSNYTTDLAIDLTPGGWCTFSAAQRANLGDGNFARGNVANAMLYQGDTRSLIENVVGGSGNDTITGNSAANIFYLQLGGNDDVSGGDGTDGFYFGGAFTAADSVDGGAGTDQIGLQGNYTLTLGADSTVGVETFVLLAGDDNRFGGATGTSLSYAITLTDANIEAGQRLAFQANTLRAGENFTLDASAETNGIVLTFAGRGTETITGSQGDDGFFFGTGRFNAGDRVNGSGGFDQIGFQGDFSAATGSQIDFGATQLVSIEYIALLSATDTRFGAGSAGQSYSYDLRMHDSNAIAGQRLVVSANALKAGERLSFNGVEETNGSFQIFSGNGNDLLIGGENADEIWGRGGDDIVLGYGGADALRGGAGNDYFEYQLVTDSLVTARDTIFDFTLGDRIDLEVLGAFTFIGDDAPTGARQVQVQQTGGNATVFIYLDGDASADMAINVVVTDSHALTADDFLFLVAPQEPLKLDDAAPLPAAEMLFDSPVWEVRHDPYLDLHATLSRDLLVI